MASQAITEACCHLLEVDRASVWLFTKDRTAITLADLFVLNTACHSSSMVLESAQYPDYFRALASEEQAIAAHDAHKDARTKEFAHSYLSPFNIGAMLDAPIRQKGQVVGVLCIEHVGGPRQWTLYETQLTSSLATMATLALEAAERREVEQALRIAKMRPKWRTGLRANFWPV